MKANFDLPEPLLKLVKLRALREGRKLKDAVADLLRNGLKVAADKEAAGLEPVISKDKKTGLPAIRCKKVAPLGKELTPERVAEILVAQEVEWYHGAGR